mgnify:FL=1
MRAEKRSEERKKIKDAKVTTAVKKAKVVKGKVMKWMKGKVMKWMKGKAVKSKVRTKVVKRARGRPAMYAGECVACVYRDTGRAGGPKHWGPDCRVLRDAAAA